MRVIRLALVVAAGSLFHATVAHGWSHEEQGPFELPARPHAMKILPTESGSPVILVLGGQVSWVIDPVTGASLRTLAIGGRDATLMDLDADGTRELVFCGPSGVHQIPWDGRYGGIPERLSLEFCDAVAVVDRPEGPHLVTAGERLSLWSVAGDGEIRRVESAEITFEDQAVLAVHGELVAAASLGGDEILEWTPRGSSRIATGGPIGGLALGPSGWAWSLPDQGLVASSSDATISVAGHPTRVVTGHIDGDTRRDLVVLHPSEGLVGVVQGSKKSEQLLHFPETLGAIGLGDVNGDGCDDVIVGLVEPPSITVLRTEGCPAPPTVAVVPRALPAEVPPPTGTHRTRPESLPDPEIPPEIAAPEEPDPEKMSEANRAPHLAEGIAHYQDRSTLDKPPSFLGVPLPPFLGDQVATDRERTRPQRYVIVGSGWAMGSTLRNVWFQIPFFPALSVELEGGGPHFRWFIGGDSAALFFWVTDDGGGIHLANASAGFTMGSPRLRIGPFVTAGLINAGAGVRTVLTPWQDTNDNFKGIEMRMTWFTPSTGEVMLLYVWSQPLRRPSHHRYDRPRRGPPPSVARANTSQDVGGDGKDDRVVIRPHGRSGRPRSPVAFAACRRIGVSAGALIGGSSTRFSWEYVGSDVPISPSFSPEIALSCRTGGKHAGLFLGFESAPFFSYLTRQDDRLHKMGSHTLGVMFGSEGFEIGPIGQVGIWTLGAGLRASLRIREDRQGLRHELELRGVALYPSAPAGEIALLYGFSFDPWKH